RWNGCKEVDHKALLFDVFHAARGHGLYTYAVRIAGLWIAVVLLALALPSVSYRILASAGAARDLHAWRGLIRFVFGRGGMLRGRWRAVAAYHRPDFHPWRYLDNRRLLSELRDTIVDPAWEGRSDRRRLGLRRGASEIDCNAESVTESAPPFDPQEARRMATREARPRLLLIAL